jgi:hypothetical protein
LNDAMRILKVSASLIALALSVLNVHSQSCQANSDLDQATHNAIQAAGQRYFAMAAKGDTASLRQNSIPSLSSDFSSIESTVKDNEQNLAATQAVLKSMFLLEAEGTTTLSHAEFFCGVFGAKGQTQNSAVFYLDNLAPGKYAVLLFDATSSKTETDVSFVLQQSGTDWKLGGVYIRRGAIAGHDSEWFVAHAREYKSKGQSHNAWWFYLEARNLLSPLPFMSTLATDSLYDEFKSLQPADVPAGGKTTDLVAGSVTYKLTAIYPDPVGDDLGLIVRYQSADASNGNQAYQSNLAVIKALVARYPELRSAFGAVVARAVDNSGHDYGTLLNMKDIK